MSEPAMEKEEDDTEFEFISEDDCKIPENASPTADGFTLVDEDDCDLEDDYAFVVDQNSLTEKSKKYSAVIAACSRHLADHPADANPCTGILKCEACYNIAKGLDILANLSANWSVDLAATSASIQHDLKTLPRTDRLLLHNILTKLLSPIWWDQLESIKIGSSYYYLSRALWVTRLGPNRLAAGWKAGKTTEAMIKGAEKKWHATHMDGGAYETEVQLLQGLMLVLSAWGRYVDSTDKCVGGDK
ncbi:hypothetical protein CC86DRAFT_433986 [Ophiobolus disseminans]|uniref:Uncharacterized protein n=1 Tax=Ophiobolus disseminans TaxID=1469910 RepID=A0A6A7AAK8_9PLEO|nr:hypothetical protein CC86DRAFT_433986 [Ophiobolus disseminans]